LKPTRKKKKDGGSGNARVNWPRGEAIRNRTGLEVGRAKTVQYGRGKQFEKYGETQYRKKWKRVGKTLREGGTYCRPCGAGSGVEAPTRHTYGEEESRKQVWATYDGNPTMRLRGGDKAPKQTE